MSWVNGPFLGFDTETTGVSPHEDRIVTAALVLRDAAGLRQRTWLIDPGVPIPDGAAAIHGITTEVAREQGRAPVTALEELATELAHLLRQGVPVVAYNAAFDLTLLEHELHRYQLTPLAARLGASPAPIIDPLVLDRSLDRYRRGKRRLGDLCEHYEVAASAELHTAEVDVAATLGVLEGLLGRFPQLSEKSLAELHLWQQAQHREWAEGFNEWRAARGLEGPGADHRWPLGELMAVSVEAGAVARAAHDAATATDREGAIAAAGAGEPSPIG